MASESQPSFFSNVALVPEPAVYAIVLAYRKDTNPLKLNLGSGVYRTQEGKPYFMNVVRRAEEILANDMSIVKEYLSITGIREFNESSTNLILGVNSPAIKEKRVSTVQCVAGCGALRVGAEFLEKHYHKKIVYIPEPTYPNHPNFFASVGLVVKTYRYYDPETHALDFQGLLEDLSSVESGAIVLLQACAHNPTGVDPTIAQWDQIRELIRAKSLLPFFDSAYLGLASGDLEEDAKSIRLFMDDGNECLIAQSYSKNMGLYADRVGSLTIVCKNAQVAKKVESQVKLVIRPMHSNPPLHGASIVTTILNNQDMFNEWRLELRGMTHRIVTMRQKLFDALLDKDTPGDWHHIIDQVGMFSLLGLNSHQIDFIIKEYHIYMSSDGRINMAGLGFETIPHLAEAIHAAVTLA